MAQKFALWHKNFAKIHPFKSTVKGILPHDTLSHNFLINCNTLSHNFYQKRTPCRTIFTLKGHPVERHIPSNQVWEYPPPPRIVPTPKNRSASFRRYRKMFFVFECSYDAIFKIPRLAFLFHCISVLEIAGKESVVVGFLTLKLSSCISY